MLFCLSSAAGHLLDVARISSGKIALQRKRGKRDEVTYSAVEIARPVIEARRHQLSVTFTPHSLTVDADPVRLAQVANLLHTSQSTPLTEENIGLRVAHQGDSAVVAVKDNGIGIAPEMIGRGSICSPSGAVHGGDLDRPCAVRTAHTAARRTPGSD
jgi:K+-sensing histidine kinase KdpD